MSKVWTPQDVYLGALRSLLHVREEPRDSNAGQAVEVFLKSCGLGKGHPWCMAVLSYVGKQCFGAAWPLPMTAGCVAAADAAQKKGIRVLPMAAQPGDIVLQWRPSLGRFAHAFVIAGPKGQGGWPTIEGNTNDGGSRDGYGMFLRRRELTAQDRCVQWWRGMV